MKPRNRFERGSGCFTCRCCGRKTRSTGRGDNEHAELCAQCFDAAGSENNHLDNHTSNSECSFVNCPRCAVEFPEDVKWAREHWKH